MPTRLNQPETLPFPLAFLSGTTRTVAPRPAFRTRAALPRFVKISK